MGFNNLGTVYITFFIVSFVFSVIINQILLKFAHNLGIRNTSETIIRWSSTSKPSLGGISFFIIFLFSVVLVSFLENGGSGFFNLQSLGVVVSVIIGFLLGLFDDAYNTKPLLKFFTQIACGVILIYTGTYIQLFENEFLNYALTIFWVVGMMNSINMLDNMDGITATVSLFIFIAVLMGIFFKGDFSNPLMVIIMGAIASMLGFLFFNWNPSRMFMGDTGSQFLGVLLSAIGIEFLWNGSFLPENTPSEVLILSVAIVFALPVIDTTTVFIKRISKGNSPFVGGKDHTTHHISYLGVSDAAVAVIYLLLSAFSVFLYYLILLFASTWRFGHTLFFAGYFIILFLVLFFIAIRNQDRSK